MAELILTPTVTVVMEMLGSATVEKLGSLWGVEDDLADLKASLARIKAVLIDAEQKQSHDNQVKLWLQSLEEVVDDADDLFDKVNSEGLRRQLATTWKKIRTSPARLKFRYKMAKEIRSVKKKMAKIAADRNNFKFVESRDEIVRPVGSGRETRSFVDEKQVVGRAGDKREVLTLMLSAESRVGQERVSVIPIVGMGGLGKTTLAQLIFDDGMVKDHFNPRIWVCVSDDFDERTIVGKIVESITDMCPRDATLEKLQTTLREKIAGKRYFLVLDDVWSENWKKWHSVKELLLNCGEPRSTIIVTTRSDKVAKLSSEVQPYRLGILDEDQSWSLFEKIAFKKGKEPADVRAVETGRKIVKKCGGIPLAIRLIAGMLSELEPEMKWSSFLDKELSSITQEDGDILPTLRLSYNSLPSNLKHCFAYCSLFPKAYEFDVETLVSLWIAQGFISAPSDGDQSLEDVGYDYFLELAYRSFFQELRIDEVMDKVLRCKMHDLVHDLAIQVGGEKYARLDHGSKPNALEKALHASLGWRESMPTSLLYAKKLRSFIWPRRFPFEKSELRSEVALDFSLLRMLDLHNSHIINEELNSIGKLKHLRYLDLSWNQSITRLPTSITKLVNLQTLKLEWCRNLCELPTDIGKLVNLRHLTWSNKALFLPRGVSQLINLQTLSYLTLSEDPTHVTLDDLLGLANLRGRVTIREIRNGMKVNGGILKEKKLFQSLELHWSYIHGAMKSANQEVEMTLEGLQPNQNLRALTVYGYSGIKFSDWLSSLRNLVELQLKSCFKLKQLSSLESLRSLRNIDVSSCKEMEYIVMDINGDGALEAPIPVFSSLQHMVLRELNKFKGWKCSNITKNEDEGVQLLSYFPCLTSLEVRDCPELISMPLYPKVKDLLLEKTNQLPFEQTATAYLAYPQISQASATTCSSSSSPPRFYPLVKVTNLCLYCRNITDVQYFPDWMQSFSCLETLQIRESKSFSLDRFKNSMSLIIKEGDEHQMSTGGNRTGWEIFSAVRELILRRVSILEHVSIAAQYLTSLENLVIEGESEDLDFSWEGLPIRHKEVFSRLKSLTISYCVILSGIPNWIFKLSSLQRLKTSWCWELESMPASLSSLTSLQSLEIEECPSLTLDDEIEWDALVSLHSLSLRRLPKLVTLPSGLQLATTLQALQLYKCENLSAPPDWICNLSSLERLEIILCPKIESLPGSIKSLTSLQTLKLEKCENLSALPDWIGNLSSLQQLDISECPKIESLPGSIKSLTSLQTLKIYKCPSLSKRCRRDTGEDWPNICHINDIRIYDETEFWRR